MFSGLSLEKAPTGKASRGLFYYVTYMPKINRSKRLLQPIFSLRDFHENRNKVLILRETGGLGDILMHRMIFEDIKLLNPNLKVVFACPKKYHEAVRDHPFVDEVLDCRKVRTEEYLEWHRTTSACSRHEMAMAPYSKKHRSDIWANHCGLKLTKHNMHIHLESSYVEAAQKRLDKEQTAPISVALCPISAMIVKNLTTEQQLGVIEELHRMNCHVYALHDKPLPELSKAGVPVWNDLSIREWMGAIDVADYVIAVDSASFHYAGGTDKPLTGIFTFADGKIYGRYFKFELVQIHRDTHEGWCGPCYYWPSCAKSKKIPKPCLTEITVNDIMKGVRRMIGH